MARKTYKVTTPEKAVDPSKIKSDKSWAGKRILDETSPEKKDPEQKQRVDSSIPSQGSNWKNITAKIEFDEDGNEFSVTYCDGRMISRYKTSSAGKIN
jgi:hypothetical protein